MRNLNGEGVVTEDIVRQFQEDGVVCIRQAFDPHWVSIVEAGVSRNLAEPSDYAGTLKAGEEDRGGFVDDYCNWQRIPEYRDFVFHSPAGAMTARLMGSRSSVFYHEHLLVKWPGTLKRTPWHHDQPYYPVNGRQNVSLWMPLDPVSEASCVQFVRGSHDWDRWFVPRKFATERNYAIEDASSKPMLEGRPFEDVPPIDDHPEDYEILAWDMEPGDVIAFHMCTLHGAAGNQSLTDARRVLATRWLGDDARFATRPWEISPTETGGLAPGDPMACDLFPRVWSA
ncbi:MAG: phytanoyl-CoA dioxygenase family protein [Gemmatimonadetes bacterium]|nr:phytanoyl-CoA dioxygenase family protein [Gemmatimonadota bacterium]